MNFRKIYELSHTRLFENLLDEKDKAHFYSFVRSELHDAKDVTIYSDEPLGSNYSCFDYNHEGDDRDKEAKEDHRFCWENCKLTMDDDGIYWKSKSGKNACALIYCITKAESKPGHIKIWVSPHDNADEMGVLDFYGY
jgi:hypothetical protein